MYENPVTMNSKILAAIESTVSPSTFKCRGIGETEFQILRRLLLHL